ncbi:hypothetical protein ACFV29_42195 [Streptomyces sp. NPDC059690]|uniref:hypothetical protein n=1 Tax=Streptomyces sp. NPDC059690 TaxID=3346907 RepID=UPI00367EBF9E
MDVLACRCDADGGFFYRRCAGRVPAAELILDGVPEHVRAFLADDPAAVLLAECGEGFGLGVDEDVFIVLAVVQCQALRGRCGELCDEPGRPVIQNVGTDEGWSTNGR